MSGEVDYTLSLALVDFIPVALSGIGTVYLARAADRRTPGVLSWGLVGAVLIVSGGAFKSSWKAIIAATGMDITWMYNLLFVCLAPGFALLAWAVWSGARGFRARLAPFVVGFAVPLLLGWVLHKTWPLLLATALFDVFLTVAAILLARHLGDNIAIGLFAVGLLLVPVLSVLGSPSVAQTTSLQWLEETINTLAQGALAYGAFRLFSNKALASRDVRFQEV